LLAPEFRVIDLARVGVHLLEGLVPREAVAVEHHLPKRQHAVLEEVLQPDGRSHLGLLVLQDARLAPHQHLRAHDTHPRQLAAD
jgi:hypothetical protein